MDGSLFCTEDAKDRLKLFTHAVFGDWLAGLVWTQQLTPANLPPRGGTPAFKLQVRDALIRAHGDSASKCYKLYYQAGFHTAADSPAMATSAAASIRAFEMRV
ncbi:hypothetical protein CYMTET_4138 [Cymbomonas tetramitiformis]|uniref:Uncharacterized protein n=1 Tax=Cymbomonas tetramitiformis TaxID=36881 RepID=A0AAE0H1S5_9CHLO|nr:hypothetical protein CYMTET_4138 [Cymbomonas tetramitiformis]